MCAVEHKNFSIRLQRDISVESFARSGSGSECSVDAAVRIQPGEIEAGDAVDALKGACDEHAAVGLEQELADGSAAVQAGAGVKRRIEGAIDVEAGQCEGRDARGDEKLRATDDHFAVGLFNGGRDAAGHYQRGCERRIDDGAGCRGRHKLQGRGRTVGNAEGVAHGRAVAAGLGGLHIDEEQAVAGLAGNRLAVEKPAVGERR